LEAILQALPKGVDAVTAKVGEISERDIVLAKQIGALVIGFNAKIRSDITRLALLEKVLMKNYTIIYELISEVKDVLAGKELAMEEKIFGKAKVKASFPFEKTKVLGVSILEGRIAKGDKVRLTRDEQIIGETTISSVRQGKEVISKVEKGQEAGIILSPFLDFTIGDVLICNA
jgi:translation initiation factor IF-2